ncbi:hypothetical protein ACOSP7_030864 [Xanthoceras sorbifolium]
MSVSFGMVAVVVAVVAVASLSLILNKSSGLAGCLWCFQGSDYRSVSLDVGDCIFEVIVVLVLLLHILSLGVSSDADDSFEDPDSGFGAFPVPAFNGDNFCLVGGAGGC